MEKSYYVVTMKPAYLELAQAARVDDGDDPLRRRIVVAITQGGFGQDVIDEERQTKERFLESLFYSTGIDLPRTAEAFDTYFELAPADEFIDLDEEF